MVTLETGRAVSNILSFE